MRFQEATVRRMVLAMGLAATLLPAQARCLGPGQSRPPGGRPPSPPPAYGPMPNRSMVENPHFMQRLYQIRASRIQQVLGLPEDRARMVAERWGRWDREHMERGEQAGAIRRQFNQILMGPGTEDEKNARIKPLMDQLFSLRGQMESGRKQFEEDIRSGLSPAQQARLILVMDEIQQKLREGLHDVQMSK
jgi:hypothetical protein